MAAAALAAPHAYPQSRPVPGPVWELLELSITQLQEGLTTGHWTAVHLVEEYFSRIGSVDTQGHLNAVIELNRDAPSIAAALDQERKSKGPRGPFTASRS